MRLRWMMPAGPILPSAGTARCWDQVFFSSLKGLSREIKMDDARFCLPSVGTARCWDQVFFSPVKGLSHEIKMYDARLCLAFSRDSEMLRSGIFLLQKDYLMRLRLMTPAGPILPSVGTARCWDQVFFFL